MTGLTNIVISGKNSLGGQLITYKPTKNEDIFRVTWKMIRIANWLGESVQATFNSKKVIVNPGDKQFDVIDSYSDIRNFERSK